LKYILFFLASTELVLVIAINFATLEFFSKNETQKFQHSRKKHEKMALKIFIFSLTFQSLFGKERGRPLWSVFGAKIQITPCFFWRENSNFPPDFLT